MRFIIVGGLGWMMVLCLRWLLQKYGWGLSIKKWSSRSWLGVKDQNLKVKVFCCTFPLDIKNSGVGNSASQYHACEWYDRHSLRFRYTYVIMKCKGQLCYRVCWPHSKRMGVMLMKNKFSFNDLMQFGIFLMALLTFIYLISH